jgi:hypothetical protein
MQDRPCCGLWTTANWKRTGGHRAPGTRNFRKEETGHEESGERSNRTAGSRANSSLLLSSAATRRGSNGRALVLRSFSFHWPVHQTGFLLETGRPGSSSSRKVSIIRSRDFTWIPLRRSIDACKLPCSISSSSPPRSACWRRGFSAPLSSQHCSRLLVLSSSSACPRRSHWECKLGY